MQALIRYKFHVQFVRFARWVGHIARTGRGEAYKECWWGNLSERDHLEDPGAEGRIILIRIFRNWGVGVWTGSSWLRIGTGGGTLVNAVMNLRVP